MYFVITRDFETLSITNVMPSKDMMESIIAESISDRIYDNIVSSLVHTFAEENVNGINDDFYSYHVIGHNEDYEYSLQAYSNNSIRNYIHWNGFIGEQDSSIPGRAEIAQSVNEEDPFDDEFDFVVSEEVANGSNQSMSAF